MDNTNIIQFKGAKEMTILELDMIDSKIAISVDCVENKTKEFLYFASDKHYKSSEEGNDINIDINITSICEKMLDKSVKSVLPVYFNSFDFSHILANDVHLSQKTDNYRKWTLIKSMDKLEKKSDEHHAVLLLVPPKTTGHYISNVGAINEPYVELNNSKNWKLYIYKTLPEYFSCSEKLIVFQSKVKLPEEFFDKYVTEIITKCYDSMLSHKKSIIEHMEAISIHEAKLDKYTSFIPKLYELQFIKFDKNEVCQYYFSQCYKNTDINDFKMVDRLCYEQLIKKYPHAKLMNISDDVFKTNTKKCYGAKIKTDTLNTVLDLTYATPI